MAEYDIIENFVSQKAKKEIEDFKKSVKEISEAIKNINSAGITYTSGTNKKSTSGKSQSSLDPGYSQALKEFDAATIKLAASQEQLAQKTAKVRVEFANSSNLQKQHAIATSENSNALQKLTAQMKILENEMLAKFNPALSEQSVEFRKLNAEHKKLQAEYQRTARATGVMGRSMNSTYGSTFQLTQVMRELPNFAIDARIGFMSLSNNLPMLADSFKQLKQQIIDTEGAAGATRKTWAAFGKSLLSLNTIMIVASTLLVLFGDDLIELVFKTSSAKKAHDEFIDSLKKGTTPMNDVLKNITELKSLMNNIDEKYITSKEVIEKYNSTLGDTLGKEETIAGIRQTLIDKGDAYIDILIRIAQANALQAIAITNVSKAESLKRDKDVAWYENIWNFTKKFAGGGTIVEALFSGTDAAVLKNRNDEAEKLLKESKDIFSDYYKQMSKIFDDAKSKGIDLLNGSKQNTDNTKREDNRKVPYLFPDSMVGKIKEINKPDTFKNLIIAYDALGAAINKNLQYAIDMYDKGEFSFEEFAKAVNGQLKIATENGATITYEMADKLSEYMKKVTIDIVNDESDKLQKRLDLYKNFYDILQTMVDSFYESYYKKLDKQQKKNDIKQEEELRQVEDKENAKIISKEAAEEEKARINDYYQSKEDDLNRKKEETEKQQFLISQAFALANIWIKYAMTITSYNAAIAEIAALTAGTGVPSALALFAPLRADALSQAILSSALVAAQTIPAFEHGGDVENDGIILAGEKRHELAVLPDGRMFITADKPTLYDVPKDTHIFPDVNKIDISSLLSLKAFKNNQHGNDKTEFLLRNIDKSIKQQKSARFYGMPLIKQLENKNNFGNRKRSIMN